MSLKRIGELCPFCDAPLLLDEPAEMVFCQNPKCGYKYDVKEPEGIKDEMRFNYIDSELNSIVKNWTSKDWEIWTERVRAAVQSHTN